MQNVIKFLVGVCMFVFGYLAVSFLINVASTPDMTTFSKNFVSECVNSGGSYAQCNCAYNVLLTNYGAKELVRVDDEYRRTGYVPTGFFNVVTRCN